MISSNIYQIDPENDSTLNPTNDISIPLLTCTTKPICYSVFSFGGDDQLSYYEGLLLDNDCNKRDDIVNRYINETCPIVKRIIEKEYALYREKVIYNMNETHPNNENHVSRQHKLFKRLWNNERQRLRIVNALGGRDFCKTIPTIYPDNLDSYMQWELKDIPSGYSLVQYEDKAGRKGVLMKLRNKITGGESVTCISQRYRETCLGSGSDGSFWICNGDFKGNIEGVDDIVEFIYKVKYTPHEVYEFV
jgi:hypothetical protein